MSTTPKKGRGRPSKYSPEIAQRICEMLASSHQSLYQICALAGFPSYTSVIKWLDRHLDFATQYTRARESQADHLAGQIIEIADDPNLDPNDKRVRVDARKWIACKLRPRRYGDHIQLEHEVGQTLAELLDSMK